MCLDENYALIFKVNLFTGFLKADIVVDLRKFRNAIRWTWGEQSSSISENLEVTGEGRYR